MGNQKNFKKKKINKMRREKIRAEKADDFNTFFSFGYDMGYNQAIQDFKKGLIMNEKEVRTCKKKM